MAFESGDFVRRMDDVTVRGHVFLMDGEMVAVTVGDIQLTSLATEWEEVPDVDLEVMGSLYLSHGRSATNKKHKMLFSCCTV